LTGLEPKAEQSASYAITKYKTAGMNRVIPDELAENVEYDSWRYVELLADCCTTVRGKKVCSFSFTTINSVYLMRPYIQKLNYSILEPHSI
jgi:hypothetical protein